MAVTEVASPADHAGVPGLPEPPGNLAGRRSNHGAAARLLVHLHYLAAGPVSEAPGAAAGPGEALPGGHYRAAAGTLSRGLEEGSGHEGRSLPHPLGLLSSSSLFPLFLSIPKVSSSVLPRTTPPAPDHPFPHSLSDAEGAKALLLPRSLSLCVPLLRNWPLPSTGYPVCKQHSRRCP